MVITTSNFDLQANLKNVVTCLQSGKLDQAEHLCNKVLESNPDHADALYLQAIISAKTQHYEMANKYFDRAIASALSRADFYGHYGNASLEQGRVDSNRGQSNINYANKGKATTNVN